MSPTAWAFNLLVQHDQVARRQERAPDYDVAAFVSVGSQIGIPPLVEDLIGRVTPFPSPHSEKTWRNLRGDVDWVAPLAILCPPQKLDERQSGHATIGSRRFSFMKRFVKFPPGLEAAWRFRKHLTIDAAA